MRKSTPIKACRAVARSAKAGGFRLQVEVVDAAPYEPEVDEPEDPDADDELDEPVEPLPVEDDVDVLSEVDDVPEELAGLAPSPEDFPSPEGFLA